MITEPIRPNITGVADGTVKRVLEDLARQADLRLQALAAKLGEIEARLAGRPDAPPRLLAVGSEQSDRGQTSESNMTLVVEKRSDLYEFRWKKEGDLEWFYHIQAENTFTVKLSSPGVWIAQARHRETPLSPWSDWSEEVRFVSRDPVGVLPAPTDVEVRLQGPVLVVTWKGLSELEYPDVKAYRVIAVDSFTVPPEQGVLLYEGRATSAVCSYFLARQTCLYVLAVNLAGNYGTPARVVVAPEPGNAPSGGLYCEATGDPANDKITIDLCESTTGWTADNGTVSLHSEDHPEGNYAVRGDWDTTGTTVSLCRTFSWAQNWSNIGVIVFFIKTNLTGTLQWFFAFGEHSTEYTFYFSPGTGWRTIFIHIGDVPAENRYSVTFFKIGCRATFPQKFKGYICVDRIEGSKGVQAIYYGSRRLAPQSIGGLCRGLYIINAPGSFMFQALDITYEAVTLMNPYDGDVITALGPNTVRVDITRSGLGGLDTGTEEASKWYNIFLVGAHKARVYGLLSLSDVPAFLTDSQGLTMDHICWVGMIYNDASSNFFVIRQVGRSVRLNEIRVIVNGTVTADTWTPLNVEGFFPRKASKLRFVCGRSGGGGFALAPSLSGLGASYDDRPPAADTAFGGVFPTDHNRWSMHEIVHYIRDQSTGLRVYYYCTATGPITLVALGWDYGD